MHDLHPERHSKQDALTNRRVVEIVGELNGYLTLREVPAGQVFDVERADFTTNLHGGYIQPVELVWQPSAVQAD